MKIKSSFLLLCLLVIVILASLISEFIMRDYFHIFLSFYTLLLLIVPTFFIKKLKITISNFFLILFYLSVFSSNILGEIYHFYINVPIFDDIVHFLTAFFMSSLVFTLIKNFTPLQNHLLLIAIISTSLSLTFSVCWEFYEYSSDKFLLTDMQKDTLISNISSSKLDNSQNYKPVKVQKIHKVILYNSHNDILKETEGGYLDIGLNDTMGDLIISFIGASLSSIFCCFYFKYSPQNQLLLIK